MELLKLALDSAGLAYQMTTMHDGGDALEILRRDPDGNAPDLVILDLNLPKYDGLEILGAARANPAFAGVPVVVLSSASSPRELSKILAYARVKFRLIAERICSGIWHWAIPFRSFWRAALSP